MSDINAVTPIVTSARLAIEIAVGLPDLPPQVRVEHEQLARERLENATLYHGRLLALGLPPPPATPTWQGSEALMWPYELGHGLTRLVVAAHVVLELALAVPPLPEAGPSPPERDAALAKLLAALGAAEDLLKRVRAMLHDLESPPPLKPKQRRCYARDHLWLSWADADAEMTPAKIRDRWNSEYKQHDGQPIEKGTADIA
jgi:hypothetical protein